MANEWHFIENQFDNATKNSRKRMNILSPDHLAKLDAEKSDADILFMHTRYVTVHDQFSNTYAEWFQVKGQYKGATQKVEELLSELSSDKIAEWDNKIKAKVGEDSADNTTLLPNGRGPFQTGGRDQRISHINALAKRLGGFPELSAVKNDVSAFHTLFEQVRHIQQTKEEAVDKLSGELEKARIATAKMMFANLGRLMDKFVDDPGQIKLYYELELIRDTSADEEEVEAIPPVV